MTVDSNISLVHLSSLTFPLVHQICFFSLSQVAGTHTLHAWLFLARPGRSGCRSLLGPSWGIGACSPSYAWRVHCVESPYSCMSCLFNLLCAPPFLKSVGGVDRFLASLPILEVLALPMDRSKLKKSVRENPVALHRIDIFMQYKHTYISLC